MGQQSGVAEVRSVAHLAFTTLNLTFPNSHLFSLSRVPKSIPLSLESILGVCLLIELSSGV